MTSMDKRFVSEKLSDAPPSTSYITRQVPINSGSNVYANQSIRFRIGGLSANQFLDPENSFIKLQIINNNGDHSFTLPPSGALGLFRQVELTQSGAVLSSFNEFGVMSNMFQNLKASYESVTVHKQLYGAGEDIGSVIGAEATRTVCLPLKHFSSLFWAGKMIPLFSKDSLELVLTLGGYDYSGYWGNQDATVDGIGNDSLQFKSAELVMTIVQTAPAVTQSLMSVDGGKFIVETKGVGHSQYTIPAGTPGNYTINLGLGYSSLEAINFVHAARKAEDTSNPNTFVSLNTSVNDLTKNFTRNHLKSYGLSVDGTLVEALREVNGKEDVEASEFLAMNLIQKGVLSSEQKLPYLLTGETSTNVPRFGYDDPMPIVSATAAVGTSLRQGHSYSTVNTLDVCVYKMKKDGICSGRNVLGSSTQLVLDYNGTKADCPLHVYSTYRQLCILDLSGSGLWNTII